MRRIPPEFQELAQYIQRKRKELGYRQSQLAAHLGVSGSYLCQVERGKMKPSDKLLNNLERKLELRPGTLFLIIGRPSMDLVRALTSDQPPAGDSLADISPAERQELTQYLLRRS